MHQMTYEELYKLIGEMTPTQRKHPVKMYIGETGELYPSDESAHPDHGFSSKLVSGNNFKEIIDYIKDDQHVIQCFMDEEGSKACQILHFEKALAKDDITDEERENYEDTLTRIKNGEDITDIIEEDLNEEETL